jgi:peptide/nickel transport system substrate-binding protein
MRAPIEGGNMRKKSALAALFVSAAIIAGACGGGASIVGSYKPGEGGTGGTLLVGDYQDVDSLHPYYYSTVMSANVLATTWDSLVTLSNEAKYVPWMATEIPTIENGGIILPGENGDAMTVTWTLREGLVWSDGVAITCADAEYTHSWVMTEGNPLSTTGAAEISDVECVDDLTIKLHYSELYSGVYGGVGIMPKHYFEKYDINSGNPATDMVLGAGFRPEDLPNVPTSGAFKFESRTEGVETVMVRNDKWKNPYSGEGTKLDRLKYVVCGDPDTCIAKFRAGELDIVTDLDQNAFEATKDLGVAQKAQSVFTYEFFRPNHSPDDCSILEPLKTTRGGGCPVSDPAIRKAIAQATDKDSIWSRLLNEAGVIASTSVTPLAWFYKEQSPVNFDLAAAKKTLTDAGWVDTNGDGVVEKDGVSAILEFCTTMKPIRKSTIAYVAGDLAKIGIKAVYNGGGTIFAPWTESDESLSCNLARGNFDVALHAYSSGIEAVSLYGTYHSSKFQPDGQNDAKVNDPALDAELDIIKGTIDLNTIATAAGKVQDIMAATTVEIPLYYWLGIELVSDKVGGFLSNPTLAGPLWNAGDLSLAN